MKKVLSIAGSDCSGGAGIQADLKTFSAHGVFGMSVIVSVVAENTSRVIDIQDITPDMIEKQIDAVFEDIEVDAVKIGMLSTPECMKAVAKKLLQYKPQNVVIDPVMYAKNGCPLMNPTAVSTLIDTVIPLADVLTPNIPEAEKIADMQISTVSDMEAAARKIYAIGRCKMNFDYTLYLVTDRQLMSCDSLTEAVEQAILGGCTMIQLREKELSSLEFYNQAVAVKQVTDKYHIPLIINDRIDIAMAVQATGVHIGQHDLPAAAVRKVIGENMLLGVSASSIAEAIQAQQDGADYLGVGAMFPTGTKTDADSVSMEELQKIRAAVSLPIVVIGGINKGNAGRFKPMGIDGLAVVSAIIAQSDIKAAAAELKDLFCGKEKKHGF